MAELSEHSPLMQTVLSRFDELRLKGKLFWAPSTPEHVEDNGFHFEFRIGKAFQQKPVLDADDPAREEDTDKNPFTDPEEGFTLAKINDTHLLQPNKFCIYRPQLLLHTIEFQRQTDDLDLSDFEATWNVMDQLGEPYIAFYNCGEPAGSSQGHKHLQLIPKPNEREFALFDESPIMRQALSADPARPCSPPQSLRVPYECYALSIPSSASASDVCERYETLLKHMRSQLYAKKGAADGEEKLAHDMSMTREWICVTPRTHKGKDGIDTNAMGMVGLVWVKDEEEKQGWMKLGLTKHLEYMGVPIQR